MSWKTNVAIICGNHINAYSLVHSLRSAGWEGDIVCLKDHDAGPALMDLWGNSVRTWDDKLCAPSDIVCLIADRIPTEAEKIIFFTDERFHETFAEEALLPRLRNARFFVGSLVHTETILDRYAFYQFIAQRDLGDVPRTLAGESDPWAVFPVKFFFRFKRSWEGLKKTARVRLIEDRISFDRMISQLRSSGYTEKDWCYQEVLSISAQHNVSISGWHEQSNHAYVASRKVMQHPPKTGNGDVCEIIDPPPGLLETTEKLLVALDYRGPFELEFVLDQNSGAYKIIELNPRFWMQHGLIGAATGEGLVRRYLGQAIPPTSDSPPRYWVNTIYGLLRLIRFDLRIHQYLWSQKSIRVPSWPITLRWLPLYVLRELRDCLFRRNGEKQ